jgi:hypothetical protein
MSSSELEDIQQYVMKLEDVAKKAKDKRKAGQLRRLGDKISLLLEARETDKKLRIPRRQE